MALVTGASYGIGMAMAKALAEAGATIVFNDRNPDRVTEALAEYRRSGIDARARQDVYRIIRELTADGVGVVVISSEVGEIAEVADRVLIMKSGRLSDLPEGVTSLEQISAATFGAGGGATC